MRRHPMMGLVWGCLLFLSLTLSAFQTTPIQAAYPMADLSSNLEQAINQFNADQASQLTSADGALVLDGSALTPRLITDVTIRVGGDNSLTTEASLQGANFLLRFPANWNHQFVFFAHGYVTPGTPGGLDLPGLSPATQAILATALSQGFAYGYSAYSKTGYAVEDGIRNTELLRTMVGYLGVTRAYIVGESMGGNITMGLVEKYPQDFAGALPYCGVVSGWYEEIRYLTDFRVVYDYFTKPFGAPLALPGAGAAETPNPGLTQEAVFQSVGALFGQAAKDPKFATLIGQISRVTGTNADPISYLTALLGNTYGLNDYLATTGGNGYGNVGKRYSGSANDDALNAGVERLQSVAAATAYLNTNYTPTGKFSAKVLSVHNLIDPLVPYEAEPILKSRVVAQNNTARFVQQVVDSKPVDLTDLTKSGPAHCYFSPTQFIFAWNELRNWVENDRRPTDDLNITVVK